MYGVASLAPSNFEFGRHQLSPWDSGLGFGTLRLVGSSVVRGAW